jgi:hypothetical protein
MGNIINKKSSNEIIPFTNDTFNVSKIESESKSGFGFGDKYIPPPMNDSDIKTYKGDEYDKISYIKVLNHYIKYDNAKSNGVWLYKSNTNDHWWICPESINSLIEGEFISGNDKCVIATLIGDINIDFVDKVQRTSKGIPRQIIRIRNDNENLNMYPLDHYEWVFITSNGDKLFDENSQNLLTENYLKKNNFEIVINDNRYFIDFGNMTEKNISSGKIHLIKFKLSKDSSNRLNESEKKMLTC